MNTTTRCYPRTSLRQSDAAYGASIERPAERTLPYSAVAWALALSLVAVVLSIVFGGPAI